MKTLEFPAACECSSRIIALLQLGDMAGARAAVDAFRQQDDFAYPFLVGSLMQDLLTAHRELTEAKRTIQGNREKVRGADGYLDVCHGCGAWVPEGQLEGAPIRGGNPEIGYTSDYPEVYCESCRTMGPRDRDDR